MKMETLPAYQNRLNELNSAADQAQSDYNQADTTYQMAFAWWQADQSLKIQKQASQDNAEAARSNAQVEYQNAQAVYKGFKTDTAAGILFISQKAGRLLIWFQTEQRQMISAIRLPRI